MKATVECCGFGGGQKRPRAAAQDPGRCACAACPKRTLRSMLQATEPYCNNGSISAVEPRLG